MHRLFFIEGSISIILEGVYEMLVRLQYSAKRDFTDIAGYVLADEYDEFFVIKRQAYRRAVRILKGKKPHFECDKPVYILGVDIS